MYVNYASQRIKCHSLISSPALYPRHSSVELRAFRLVYRSIRHYGKYYTVISTYPASTRSLYTIQSSGASSAPSALRSGRYRADETSPFPTTSYNGWASLVLLAQRVLNEAYKSISEVSVEPVYGKSEYTQPLAGISTVLSKLP